VRRLAVVTGLVALAVALAVAPGAHAAGPCGVTATQVRGAAPHAVTFTAACTSAAYAWDFGDGTQGSGQSVRHVYPAGLWHPTLTSDAGSEPAPSVTSIAVTLSGPRVMRNG
jgi:chitodextrinase